MCAVLMSVQFYDKCFILIWQVVLLLFFYTACNSIVSEFPGQFNADGNVFFYKNSRVSAIRL